MLYANKYQLIYISYLDLNKLPEVGPHTCHDLPCTPGSMQGSTQVVTQTNEVICIDQICQFFDVDIMDELALQNKRSVATNPPEGYSVLDRYRPVCSYLRK